MSKLVPICCAIALILPMGFTAALPLEGNVPAIFGIGVAADSDRPQMVDSMPITYYYQYFTAGFDYGWGDWNSPEYAFADIWLGVGESNGWFPVITYYQVVPSDNSWMDPPTQQLTNTSNMANYYADFRALLDKIAAYDKPVIVHLEPDLLGYFEQWATASNPNDPDPTSIPVAVASSGYAGTSGYQNNARDFFRFLHHLRDTYAPKVILGWQASLWANGTDLIVNQGDPVVIANDIATFWGKFGVTPDVIFSEFSDRDSGFYQQQGKDRWWTDADFDRQRTFLSQFTTLVGKKAILWQIPIGNTWYRACNNTDHHYQDNRAEYFFESVLNGNGDMTHLQEYRDAGVVALLFGQGEARQTRYWDVVDSDFPALPDGVTNPAPINNVANKSGHDNTRTSLNADNDGGYLRAGITAYYQYGALPWSDSCNGTTVTITNQDLSGTVTCTATTSITAGPAVQVLPNANVNFHAPTIQLLPGFTTQTPTYFRAGQ